MEHWMLEHKFLVHLGFFILILGLVWLIMRIRFKDTYMAIKKWKLLYRVLIYLAIAVVGFLFMIIASKFGIVTAILIIGLPGALLGILL